MRRPYDRERHDLRMRAREVYDWDCVAPEKRDQPATMLAWRKTDDDEVLEQCELEAVDHDVVPIYDYVPLMHGPLYQEK